MFLFCFVFLFIWFVFISFEFGQDDAFFLGFELPFMKSVSNGFDLHFLVKFIEIASEILFLHPLEWMKWLRSGVFFWYFPLLPSKSSEFSQAFLWLIWFLGCLGCLYISAHVWCTYSICCFLRYFLGSFLSGFYEGFFFFGQFFSFLFLPPQRLICLYQF